MRADILQLHSLKGFKRDVLRNLEAEPVELLIGSSSRNTKDQKLL